MKILSILLWLSVLATSASAQSMSVPHIVDTVMGQVCVPYARDGDIRRAVKVAQALGYVIMEERTDLPISRDNPVGSAELSRRHHGTVMLDMTRDRGLCAVGIYEGGPSNMREATELYARTLGLEPVIEERDGQGASDTLIWHGGTTRLAIARSPRFSPGSELTLSFIRPGRQGRDLSVRPDRPETPARPVSQDHSDPHGTGRSPRSVPD